MILAVVGDSGSGKTTGVEFASKALDIPVVRSYTTRPMREGEVDGVDHIFVTEDEMPPKEDMLAYTFFGGYHYWTLRNLPEKCLYVIDEDGLRMLLADKSNDVIPIYVERKDNDVDDERKARDNDRKKMSHRVYKAFVNNDGCLEKFLWKFTMAVAVVTTEPVFINNSDAVYVV